MAEKALKYSEKSFLPSEGESIAIALREKAAAFCYDRIWSCTEEMPESIRCFGGSSVELAIVRVLNDPRQWLAQIESAIKAAKTVENGLTALQETGCLFLLRLMIVAGGAETRAKSLLSSDVRGSALMDSFMELLAQLPRDREELLDRAAENMGRLIEVALRDVAKSFSEKHGICMVPIYTSVTERDRLYKEGDREALLMALANLSIVDEHELTWEQVLDFRKDKQARKNYRRLLHWLDAEMLGKSQAFVEDEIAIRLNEYEQALKRHGIRTILGTVEEALDGRFLAGAASVAAPFVLAGEPGLGGLAGGILIGGKIGVKLMQSKLDFDDVERGPNSEISWVYEVKQLGK